MNFNEVKSYIEDDLKKYNSFDDRNLTNQGRDIFMGLAFITFFLALIIKFIHLLCVKLKVF
jgi:hypothetical protein